MTMLLETACRLTVEHDEDLLPLRVAHFGRLAEQQLVLVADEDPVQDELGDGDVSQAAEAGVSARRRQPLVPPVRHKLPIGLPGIGGGLEATRGFSGS